jgi:hypothetical protein
MMRLADCTGLVLVMAAVAACATSTLPEPTASPRVEHSPAPQPTDTTNGPTVPPDHSPGPTIASTPATPVLGDVHALMAETITADRPLLRFDLHPDRLDGSWILDGNADDGFGPGRLYVVVTPRRGDLTANPCGDPDFRQGGRCTEQVLTGGDRLVLRDRVTGGGVTTVLAVLIHPDRSGLSAEASTIVIDLSTGPIGPDGPPPPTVGRAEPLYTARELGALLIKIADRLRTAG